MASPATPPQDDLNDMAASLSLSACISPPLSFQKERKIPRKVAKRLKTITFAVVDPKVPPGDYGSADFPSALSVENYAREVGSSLLEKDAAVIPHQEVKIHFKSFAPLSSEDSDLVVPATAEDGRTFFSRADLARAICRQFKIIYGEEEEGGGAAGTTNSRAKYRIPGVMMNDLLLGEVIYDPVTKVCTLSLEP